MDLHFGADVQQPDGGKVGELRRIVYDPETWEVTFLVVEHGGFGRLSETEMLVPIGAVTDTDDESVQLALSQKQFDRLEHFVTRNVAPPPERDHSADLDEDLVDVPDVPPVGAATGVESIAFTPVVEEAVHMPAWDRIIDAGSTVWATDGEAGRLVTVSVDEETHRLSSLLVERGTVFTKTAEIPAAWVADVQPDTVVLNVPFEKVESVTPAEL